MNTKELIHTIREAIKLAQDEKIYYETLYSSSPGNSPHEFLFFIKPEITKRSELIDLSTILEMVFNKMADFHFSIDDIRLLSAKYLDDHDIIAQHYGVINTMSKDPSSHLSLEAKENFMSSFGKNPEDVPLTGSIEFLNQFPEYNALSVNELWQKSITRKLAGGTYCANVKISGKDVYLINGFHPLQLIHFTEKGRSIVTFRLSSHIDWATARNQFIGKTNPVDALPGSLRNILLEGEQQFGLNGISSSHNGFHLSAGPVEALVELIRYCSNYSENKIKTIEDFQFGKELVKNFSWDDLEKILNNHLINHRGQAISTFDLTEEKNNTEALQLLKDSIF